MSDYTWLQRGKRYHAFAEGLRARRSLCGQVVAVRGDTFVEAPPAADACANCLRVVERARAAAQPARRLVSSAEMREQKVQEAVLAEVRAHVPKASSQRLTTLVASRIAVRELRDELKAIEEGLSKRFVLAHRKLDTLEQVFEALTKEIAP